MRTAKANAQSRHRLRCSPIAAISTKPIVLARLVIGAKVFTVSDMTGYTLKPLGC